MICSLISLYYQGLNLHPFWIYTVFIERNASTTSSINNLSPKTNNVNMFLRQSPSADLSDTGSFVQTPEKPTRKDNNILPIRGNNRSSNRMMGPEIDEQSPQLLPYQHRKKLSQKEEVMTPDLVQHNNMIEQQLPPPMDQSPGIGESSKRPPLPGANNRGVGGGIEQQQQLGAAPPPPHIASPITAALLANRGIDQQQQQLPPPPMPMHNTMSSPPPSASKYKVAVIPPFRGGLDGGGQSHERSSSMEDESIEQKQRQGGSGGKMKKMRKVKSAQSSSTSSRKNRKNKRGNNSGGNNNNPNQSSKATPDNNGDKFRPPRHEVIDPTPPPPLPQSPRQGGYHVRVSSQSSISSLESKAATDAEGQQPQQQQKIPHPNTSEYWYYQQKQLQQQYNARQNQLPQNQPRVPNAGGGGNFNVNFNAVLGPEVASFLHAEEIASAVERRQQGVMPHPNSHQYGGTPPPQQQWNDPRQQYGVGQHQQQWVQGQHPGVYGQSLEGHLIPNNHPLPPQQQPHGYPGYHPEPQAPPLTYQHPNMHYDKRQHRERLPSVSEDDFDEMLEGDKQNREGNNRNRQQQQQWNQQQQYSRQYNNPQQQQWNQQQYPPR